MGRAAKRPRVLIIHFGQIAQQLSRAQAREYRRPDAALGRCARTRWTPSGGMVRLTPELIAKAAPDIILATDVGFDRYGSAAKFATMPGVDSRRPGKSLRIYRIDETDVMYYGPRTPEAIRRLEGFFIRPRRRRDARRDVEAALVRPGRTSCSRCCSRSPSCVGGDRRVHVHAARDGALPRAGGRMDCRSTPDDALGRNVFLQLRLPRVLIAGLTGAVLGVSGTLMQGLFRNPIVEPGLGGHVGRRGVRRGAGVRAR